MAKKPAVSYAGLGLDDAPNTEPAGRGRAAEAGIVSARKPRTLKEAASAVVLYLHPAAHKQIKQWCLDEGIRVHDFLIEAVEASMRSKGLRATVRAEVTKHERG